MSNNNAQQYSDSHLKVWGPQEVFNFHVHQGCIYLIKNTEKKSLSFP